MAYDRFLIAPFNTGLQTDLKPWLILDDSFATLNNAYVFRGRVRKRFGSALLGNPTPGLPTQTFGRLRISLGETDNSGNISVTVPGSIFAIGQMFSIQDEIFTVVENGPPGVPGVLLTTGDSTVHTFNTTSGLLEIDGAAASTVCYYYPAQPVMGFANFGIGPINNQPSYAFDTQFAYVLGSHAWSRSGTTVWHSPSGAVNYFWAYSWRGTTPDADTLYVTNYQVTNPANGGTPEATDDPIYYLSGGSWAALVAYFAPGGGAPRTGPFVQTARIVIPFKGRLLLLNTIETVDGLNYQYVNRCRFSYYGNPLAQNAWYEPNQSDNGGSTPLNFAGGAGFIDASTEEALIGAEFIKDRLIVYFERSTWELAYTGNQVEPFTWQKINTELGSESTFSTVPFDKNVLAIGSTGVHACNGANVERIDGKIPQQIFTVNKSRVAQIQGIRDYRFEMVYWSYPSDQAALTDNFPDQVLVYNYQNDSWAINDDCITAFGYYEQIPDIPNLDPNARQIIAGNQQGYTFLIDADLTFNASNLQITDMVLNGDFVQITCINHNLSQNLNDGDGPSYVLFDNIVGPTEFNDKTYYVFSVIDADNFLISATDLSTPYLGGGTMATVSNITIVTKQFNPYVDQDRNVYIAKVDFGVEATIVGEVTVDYYPSATTLSMLQAGELSGAILGTGILETFPYPDIPLEAFQERLWHPIYFQTQGQCIQLVISMSQQQMLTPAALEDFQLDGMILYTTPTSSRLGS